MSLIHLLSGAGQLTAAAVVCGDRTAAVATWDAARATCPSCLGGRAPCTCAAGTPECAVCAAWRRTHRTDGARLPVADRPALRTEKQFQEVIRQAALAAGWIYYHPQISLHNTPGFPDTTLVRLDPSGAGARLLFAELKMPGQDPSAAQQRWLAALGHVTTVQTFLWRPDDLVQALEVLR